MIFRSSRDDLRGGAVAPLDRMPSWHIQDPGFNFQHLINWVQWHTFEHQNVEGRDKNQAWWCMPFRTQKAESGVSL